MIGLVNMLSGNMSYGVRLLDPQEVLLNDGHVQGGVRSRSSFPFAVAPNLPVLSIVCMSMPARGSDNRL